MPDQSYLSIPSPVSGLAAVCLNAQSRRVAATGAHARLKGGSRRAAEWDGGGSITSDCSRVRVSAVVD